MKPKKFADTVKPPILPAVKYLQKSGYGIEEINIKQVGNYLSANPIMRVYFSCVRKGYPRLIMYIRRKAKCLN